MGTDNLTALESKRATALFNKQAAIQICEHRLISMNRDQLPSP
jgi:hypothetical protein